MVNRLHECKHNSEEFAVISLKYVMDREWLRSNSLPSLLAELEERTITLKSVKAFAKTLLFHQNTVRQRRELNWQDLTLFKLERAATNADWDLLK